MNFTETGIILSTKIFSETARLLTIFNQSWGKFHAIFKNQKTSVQIGDISQIAWHGRSAESLGSVTLDTISSPFIFAINNPKKIYAIESACSLCARGMPEKAPHKALFDFTKNFLQSIPKEDWLRRYVCFELAFLSEVGFGLDLSKCAITGQSDVYYLSPKSGRAVIKSAGEKYKDKLFVIPQFLRNSAVIPTPYEVFSALQITTHFLKTYFYDITNGKLPLSREYLMNRIKNGDVK